VSCRAVLATVKDMAQILATNVTRNNDKMNPDRPISELDVAGLQCPLPVLRARKVLAGMGPGSLLRVRATDPVARIDMPHFCAQAGHELLETTEDGRFLLFLIRRGASAPAPSDD